MIDRPLIKDVDGKLHTVIESVPNGIILVDEWGQIVLCNSETERMFKYERGELIGQRIEALVPLRFLKAHVSDRQHFIEKPSKRQMGAGRDLS